MAFRSTAWTEDETLRSAGRRRLSYRTGGRDSFWNQTELLLPLDADFRDYSRNRREVLANGGVSISTAQSKWGKASAYFNGTTDGLYARDVGIGTGDFTIELFFKSASSVQYAQLIGNENTGFSLLVNNNSSTGGQITCYVGSALVSSSAGDFTDDVWHHVALGRSGTSVSLWIDGTRLGTATSSASFTGQDIWIGRNNYVTPRNLIGYIQDVRVTKASRYSGASISVPTKFPGGTLVRA